MGRGAKLCKFPILQLQDGNNRALSYVEQEGVNKPLELAPGSARAIHCTRDQTG